MEEQNNSKIKFQRQIELQQTEEELRITRGHISALETEIRKYRQEFTRAEMDLRQAEDKMKNLKNSEFELIQRISRQKKTLVDASAS